MPKAIELMKKREEESLRLFATYQKKLRNSRTLN